MAKCDEGYLCEICGQPVERMKESSLYLQFIIGWIDPEILHTRADSHLACHPALAQFIEHPKFPRVQLEGEFDRRQMDPEFVRSRAQLVTRGYERLLELQRKRSDLKLQEYPLPDAADKWS